MAGFSLLFIESLVGTLFNYYILPQMLGGSVGRDRWMYDLIWFVRAMFQAGFWCLILVAIFGWRSERRYDAGEGSGYAGD